MQWFTITEDLDEGIATSDVTVYTDGSKIQSGTGVGIYSKVHKLLKPTGKISYSLTN